MMMTWYDWVIDSRPHRISVNSFACHIFRHWRICFQKLFKIELTLNDRSVNWLNEAVNWILTKSKKMWDDGKISNIISLVNCQTFIMRSSQKFSFFSLSSSSMSCLLIRLNEFLKISKQKPYNIFINFSPNLASSNYRKVSKNSLNLK